MVSRQLGWSEPWLTVNRRVFGTPSSRRKRAAALARLIGDRKPGLTSPLGVGVAFDENEVAGILEHPASVLLHEPGTARADVETAGLEEHVLECRLLGELVDALGRPPRCRGRRPRGARSRGDRRRRGRRGFGGRALLLDLGGSAGSLDAAGGGASGSAFFAAFCPQPVKRTTTARRMAMCE